MFKYVYTTRMSGNFKALERRFDKINGRPVKFKRVLTFACVIVILSVFALGTLVMAEFDGSAAEVKITNNGEVIELNNKPFVENGEIYVPLRELFTKLGFMSHPDAKLDWDNGVVLICLIEENQNEDSASKYTSYSYKIEIGKSELVINPDELIAMNKSYLFTEPMNLAPVLKGNVTYVPFAYAKRIVERADNGIQSPSDRYNLEFMYAGEVLSILYPFEEKHSVTSAFGERIHPVTGEKKFHSGMDIRVDEGTEVKCGIDGRVIEEGFNNDNGNYIIIKNDYAVEILYAHLASVARRGEYEVKKGDVVGKSGNTGKSTGPHLHIEVKINGEYVNPALYMAGDN